MQTTFVNRSYRVVVNCGIGQYDKSCAVYCSSGAQRQEPARGPMHGVKIWQEKDRERAAREANPNTDCKGQGRETSEGITLGAEMRTVEDTGDAGAG